MLPFIKQLDEKGKETKMQKFKKENIRVSIF
jgi:hypothetical protein